MGPPSVTGGTVKGQPRAPTYPQPLRGTSTSRLNWSLVFSPSFLLTFPWAAALSPRPQDEPNPLQKFCLYPNLPASRTFPDIGKWLHIFLVSLTCTKFYRVPRETAIPTDHPPRQSPLLLTNCHVCRRRSHNLLTGSSSHLCLYSGSQRCSKSFSFPHPLTLLTAPKVYDSPNLFPTSSPPKTTLSDFTFPGHWLIISALRVPEPLDTSFSYVWKRVHNTDSAVKSVL